MRKVHREVFFAYNGPGPYTCWDCGVAVDFDCVHVHHVDHDHSNNDPVNLVPVHHACHTSLHKRGRNLSPQHREAIGAGLRGGTRMISSKQRLKLSGALKGIPKSEETKQRMSDAQKIPTHRCECGKMTRSGPMTRHTRATGHVAEKING